MQAPLEITSNNETISASVIWLHGLGANGYDFEPVVKSLNCPHIRFILPHAPARPVTLNQGHVMPAWYDLYGLTANDPTDEAGIEASADYIKTLVATENARGIPSNRIVLAGFSQGGAVALHTATRFTEPLAGVVALSTYLPLAEQLVQTKQSINQTTPWLIAHGEYDDVIQLSMAQQTQAHLSQAGFNIQFHTFPIAHQVCQEEIDVIETYLLKQLASN